MKTSQSPAGKSAAIWQAPQRYGTSLNGLDDFAGVLRAILGYVVPDLAQLPSCPRTPQNRAWWGQRFCAHLLPAASAASASAV